MPANDAIRGIICRTRTRNLIPVVILLRCPHPGLEQIGSKISNGGRQDARLVALIILLATFQDFLSFGRSGKVRGGMPSEHPWSMSEQEIGETKGVRLDFQKDDN
ncbi:uncharacterized protein LDX57_004610 [Aspergillus melleus]|uniref:uncharacterized protein n=1 Tax=Aspergillus melleus TaxID=138277 RepID=UPI001E8E5454|nr:uncharacterized protein LDX57_004610 [Aspergillus melleus]KAH8426884.1 hypothetical protein LDX57_004610 [Aspergillus melleus]